MKSAKNFFTKEEQQKIMEAITDAEHATSSEIRVHVENFCIGSAVKRAEKVFHKLNMHKTKHQNAVLFYFATVSRKMAIIGDKGIHEKVGDAFWDQLVTGILNSFKHDKDKTSALCTAIVEVGSKLKQHFPIDDNDTNELPNEISIGK